jgi:hypothetical protein
MEIPIELVDKIMSVLVHNIGDTRSCPVCLHAYTPKDRTVNETLEVYRELKELIKKNG